MLDKEDYILNFADHEQKRNSALQILWKNNDFLDVTIACDDDQIDAHKVILSAASPFFRKILKRNPHSHPLLYMRGTSKKQLEALIEFIYSGQTKISEEDLEQFLGLAKSLQIDGLYRENNIEKSTLDNEAAHKTDQQESNTLDHKKQLDMVKEDEGKASNQSKSDFLDLTVSDSKDDVSEIIDKYSEPSTCEVNNSVSPSELSNNSFATYNQKVSELIAKTESGFRCRECSFEKPRARADHVRRHVEIHIKGFSFNCGYCSKTFSQNTSVRKHERKCREYIQYQAI